MTLNDLVCPYTVCDKNVAPDPSFKQGTMYVDIRVGSHERGRQMRVGVVENGNYSILSLAISSEPSTVYAKNYVKYSAVVVQPALKYEKNHP